MKKLLFVLALALSHVAMANEIAKFDPRMAAENAVITNGVKWINAIHLPIEGKAFKNTKAYFHRLPSTLTTNVNAGVRSLQSHTTGMLLRFKTDSSKISIKWTLSSPNLAMHHMPSTGVSGVDIYKVGADGKYSYVRTGIPRHPSAPNQTQVSWNSEDTCIVYLPLYNGVKEMFIGIDEKASIFAPQPHTSKVVKPVVFYGTSITHGGCASRPGLSFVNIIGRDLDLHVINLGFSGSGKMEMEMSEHLAAIDASCYVLDCLWNMGNSKVKANYEPFIRNLRAKRPDVPIVMAGQCDVYYRPGGVFRFAANEKLTKDLYEKLIAEGWKNLSYLPYDGQFSCNGEGTVDGCHPNDLGMMEMSKAYGNAVKKALGL